MTNEEQLIIRETLAKAQGWEWVSKDTIRNPESLWITCVLDDKSDIWPNPFVNADDLLALMEWARKQKWFHSIGFDDKSVWVTCETDITLYGQFQEILPLAIYQALKEIENAE